MKQLSECLLVASPGSQRDMVSLLDFNQLPFHRCDYFGCYGVTVRDFAAMDLGMKRLTRFLLPVLAGASALAPARAAAARSGSFTSLRSQSQRALVSRQAVPTGALQVRGDDRHDDAT